MRLDELASRIDAQLVGDGSVDVSSVASLDTAGPGEVGFLANPKYSDQLQLTRASAVIVGKRIDTNHVPLLKTADPYFAFQQAAVLLCGHRRHVFPGVHPDAHVDPTAMIGEGTVIYPLAYVGPRCRIGRDCIVYPNCTIYEDTQLGDRVIVHGGSVVGVDGFGFATHAGVHHKIPQVGRVVVEDDVEIGANCVIARAALDETRIGKGTKIDGLVIVGHGSSIGAHGLLVAQTGVAGSVTIGHHVTMGGQTGVAGHLKIGDNVSVAAQSGVMGDIEDKQVMIGSPAMPAQHARRVYSLFTKLPELFERLRELEQRVVEMDGSKTTTK